MIARVADVADRATENLAARAQIGDADAVVIGNFRAMELECLDVLEMDKPERGIGGFGAAMETDPLDEERAQLACEHDVPPISRTQHGLSALADKADSLRKVKRIDGEVAGAWIVGGARLRRFRASLPYRNRARRHPIRICESLCTEIFDRREGDPAGQKTSPRHSYFFAD